MIIPFLSLKSSTVLLSTLTISARCTGTLDARLRPFWRWHFSSTSTLELSSGWYLDFWNVSRFFLSTSIALPSAATLAAESVSSELGLFCSQTESSDRLWEMSLPTFPVLATSIRLSQRLFRELPPPPLPLNISLPMFFGFFVLKSFFFLRTLRVCAGPVIIVNILNIQIQTLCIGYLHGSTKADKIKLYNLLVKTILFSLMHWKFTH